MKKINAKIKETIAALKPDKNGIIQSLSVPIPREQQDKRCQPSNEIRVIQLSPFREPLFF